MAVRKDTIFERFLGPVMRLFLDEAEMRRLHESIDWEREIAQFQRDIEYPSYYISQNFHGIEGGYLTADAAVSYDPITQYVLPPNETLVRQGAIDAISGQPRRILDLGCGTGSMTLMLQQAFPEAEVIGLDLSPYMLCIAQRKAQAAGLEIQWVHGNAEKTDFPDAAFDLVTASLLYHETPPRVAQAIARESFRLLKTGGEFIVFDGNQKTLRHTEWLTDIFEEPYIRDYAKGSVDAWMGAAGFGAVRTEEHWWVNQVTRGVKPIANSASESPSSTAEWVQQPSFA
ncbi:class I SAM-dependent methyltransferase [Phormidium sp. CCY1219]|uniref:class I SAM-dependent methyltransferase n=1 Tax=Phormidium sp. CCY1219 TaxID=2886104 RepID=UPI002D1F892B|nr:methyltransferase domain-containing protein [Phormidium sp. CCY1219]MEB3829705.1 methyltransferase domain-containing protein [Phormidium sp. CCY1219]